MLNYQRVTSSNQHGLLEIFKFSQLETSIWIGGETQISRDV
jgi:hypothetical protein